MKMLIGILVLILNMNISSQINGDYFDVKKRNYNIKSWDAGLYAIHIINDTVFFLNPNKIKSDTGYVFEVFISKDNLDSSIKFTIPYLKRLDIVDLLVDNNNLYLLDLQNIWIVKRNNLKLITKVKLMNTFKTMSFNPQNKSIIELSMCGYSSFNKDSLSQTYCCSFDIEKNIQKYQEFENPLGLNLTYIVKQLQSYRNNIFVLAEPTTYDIKVFDLINADTFMISSNKFNESKSEKLNNSNKIQPHQLNLVYHDIINLKDTIQLIEYVELIGNDSLAIIWSKPNQLLNKPRELFLDIWNLSKGNHTLIIENLSVNEIRLDNDLQRPSLYNARFKNGYFYKINSKFKKNNSTNENLNNLELFLMKLKYQ